MSIFRTLTDKLKAALSVSDANGLSILLKDGNGVLESIPYSRLGYTELHGSESAGSVMSLKDFTLKYVQGKRIGHIFTDSLYDNSKAWYVAVANGVSLCTQRHTILLLKNNKSLSGSWANIVFAFIPSSKESNTLYIVGQQTQDSASRYSVSVLKMDLETVTVS